MKSQKPKIKFLSNKLIEKIINEACIILENIGVTIHHQILLENLSDLGCKCDFENKHVFIKPEIIHKCLSSVPKQIKLYNIKGNQYYLIGGNKVHFTPGSTAIKIYDCINNIIRIADCDDMIKYNKIVEQLQYIDYSSTAIVPNDVPEEIGDSIRLYTLLKMTSKPIVTGAFTINGFYRMLEMILAVRETYEQIRKKPFTIFSCCPTSPLKWSHVTSDNTMKCANYGIPVEFISMPLSGFMGPISLVGSLIQHTAETLSGVIISQITRPGAPILWGGSPGTFDMRTMKPCISSIETQMMDCSYSEIGKYLNIPTQAYIGLSDSETFDVQSGFESGTGMYLAALAGINSVSGPGMLLFESCLSLEKLIFDNEICGMSQKLIKGIEHYDEDFPSLPIFEELITKQNLLTSDSTIKYLRDAHYIPGPVINRGSGDVSVSVSNRASLEVNKLISKYNRPDILDSNQKQKIDSFIPRALKNKLDV